MSRKISTRWFDSKEEEDAPAEVDDDEPVVKKIDLKLKFLS
jgi:hypothetical protein